MLYTELDPENDPQYAHLITLLRELPGGEPDPGWQARVWARAERMKHRLLLIRVLTAAFLLMLSACYAVLSR